MTLTDLPTVFRRTERKHRSGDTIRRLRRQIRALLDLQREAQAKERAADDFFQRLLADRHQLYAAWQFAERKRQEAEQVAMQTLEENARLANEMSGLLAELAPHRAAAANAHRIDVPPMVRDTTAIEDQATGPIDVRPLWAARDAGLLGAVDDPGNVAGVA